MLSGVLSKAPAGFEPAYKGFADLRLTAWLWRRTAYDPWGTRTPVTAVKGPCLNLLTNGPRSVHILHKPTL